MEQHIEPAAAACSRQSCDGCEIEGDLICVATPLDLADFGILFVNWIIPFLAGMIAGQFWIGLAVWFGLAVLFFGYVEAFVLCRHCPAYAEEGFTLRCHANWGLPKIPRFDPRPMNRLEGATFLGYGAVLFTALIEAITDGTVLPFVGLSATNGLWLGALLVVPALGLLAVSWFTRRFAPEAQGHGVPEVMTAVARHDGVIRPRVALVKILASGVCIGTGGSAGREGPIVQIGSAAASWLGQLLKMPPRQLRTMVGCGSAAGIAATFNAPIAGALFAVEIIPPLMTACVISTLVTAAFTGDSIYTQKLRRRGVNLAKDEDPNILKSLFVRDIVDRQPEVVPASASFSRVMAR